MENSPKCKRIRASNFTPSEKMLLFNVVAGYKNIIENKKTDQVTTQEKNNAWTNITIEYNASTANQSRSTECLKRLYDNQKKQTRKLAADEKKEMYLTGGGPLPNFKKDPSHDLILSIVNEKTLSGLVNRFDGDVNEVPLNTNEGALASPLNSEENATTFEFVMEDMCSKVPEPSCNARQQEESEVLSCNQNVEPNDSNAYNKLLKQEANNQLDWKKYKPAHLQSEMSLPLRNSPSSSAKTNTNEDYKTPAKRKYEPSRRRPVLVKALTSSDLSEKYNTLVDIKLEIAKFQKKNLENTLAMEAEEHKLKIQLLEIQIEIEKCRLKKLERCDI